MPISPKRAFSTASKERSRRGASVWHMSIGDILARRNPGIPHRELAVFCRKAAFLFDAGLPVKEAMPVLAGQIKGRAAIISDLHSLVMQGESFSGSLRSVTAFPAFMCGYIAIGERTATLPQVCARLADFYEQRAQTEEELAAAMTYPAIVSTMMLAVIVLAVTFVLPGYSQIFYASGIALPAATSVLLGIANFLAGNTAVVFAAFFALIFAFAVFLRCDAGQVFTARVKLKFPLSRQNVNLRLAQAFSLLLQSGLGVSESIPMCAELVENPVVRGDLEKLSSRVNSGKAFWEGLAEISYINPLFAGLARIGEGTGNLPQTMEKCRAYFETEYHHNLRRFNKLIEPAVTLILGAVLAAVMLAIILPAFELATAV